MLSFRLSNINISCSTHNYETMDKKNVKNKAHMRKLQLYEENKKIPET